MTTIQVQHAVKKFRETTALNNITFNVPPGQTVAILGPNGAGKSTLIDVLVGLTPLDSGVVEVMGRRLPQHARTVRESIGLCLQSNQFLPRLTVRETLALYQEFYKNHRPVGELLELVRLTDKAHEPVSKLSGGQQQRVALAVALVNDPALLFLDEPTTGLDPQARHDIWDLVASTRREGRTVILTTHYMEEAHQLAERVIILDRGQIVADDTPDRLIHRYAPHQVLKVTGDYLDRLASLGWAPESVKGSWRRALGSDQPLELVLAEARTQGARLRHISIEESSLEDVFLTLTGRSLTL